ncbi:MAG: hypothetical protein APF80_09890 [Alphaproteobacteria bacterium BRH_c36]|nr:MAG: hypothetical protein APF80_09890 [Alphaproteobacteria bacterium BRH_c36]
MGHEGVACRYVFRELTAGTYGDNWPFGNDTVLLVRPEINFAAIFVLNGEPYAANGFTRTFAKKWSLKLEVDGEMRPVQPYDGRIGNIIDFIDGSRAA